MVTQSVLSLYDAALASVAYYRVPNSGCIRIAGEHRLDFLQRQTSNDVNLLTSDSAVLTVLTTPAGRIMDVLYLLPDLDTVLALTLPGVAADTTSFLYSRIFFMDKVELQDQSKFFVQVDLIGPCAESILDLLGFEGAPETNHICSSTLGTDQLLMLGYERSIGLGYRLIASTEAWNEVEKILTYSGTPIMDNETYHVLRVESGIPYVDHELTQDFTPLEIGLDTAVSGEKGCYTGQEVLARQMTYGKVIHNLCGIRLESEIEKGSRIWADGRKVGELTSVAYSPRYNWLGLAVINRRHNKTGSELLVGNTAEGGVPAKIVPLPFR